MRKVLLTSLGATSLAFLAGCGGGGGSNGVASNAVGYYADTNFYSDRFDGSGRSKANISLNDDDSVTVRVDEGPYSGDETTFYYDYGSDQYVADLDDGARAYMVLDSFDDPSINGDEPVVALIEVDGGGTNSTFSTYRATEGMTTNMPRAGTARYEGGHFGIAAIPGDDVYDIEGSFAANVDFGNASMNGAMATSVGDVTFDGSIDGPNFSSNNGSIALNGDRSLIDQGASGVDGGFYGDNAKGMAGTYLINGDNGLDGAGMLGNFVGERTR